MSRVTYVKYTILNLVGFPRKCKLQHLRIADLQKIYEEKAIQSMSKMPTFRTCCILFVNCKIFVSFPHWKQILLEDSFHEYNTERKGYIDIQCMYFVIYYHFTTNLQPFVNQL